MDLPITLLPTSLQAVYLHSDSEVMPQENVLNFPAKISLSNQTFRFLGHYVRAITHFLSVGGLFKAVISIVKGLCYNYS